MGFSKYFYCNEKQADLLLNDLYNLTKNTPDAYYTNIPSVMFSTYNHLLISHMGLEYSFSDGLMYYFNIMDEKKFMLTKVKHGI
jgi:hypothetical protein